MISSDKIDRKFAFVLAAAKRARQLQAGAKPLVSTTAHKHTRMAMDEVGAGVVPYELPVRDDEADEGKKKKGKKRSK